MRMVWRGFNKSGMDDSRTKTPSVCCNWAILFPLWKLWPSSHPHTLNALHVPETQASGPNTVGTGTSVRLAAKVCSLVFPSFMPFPESHQKHSFFLNLLEDWQIHETFLYSLGSKITRVSCTSTGIDHIFVPFRYQFRYFCFPSWTVMRSSHTRSAGLFSSVSRKAGKCLLNLAQKKNIFEGHNGWAEHSEWLRWIHRHINLPPF